MSYVEDARRAVLEHPADLAARLAYANTLDARHDPLGEFIRLECQLAQSSSDGDEALRLWDRRLALLEAHGSSWLAPLSGMAESTHFERGLVEWICLDLDTYLARGAELFARFPIRSVTIRAAHGRIGELLASPWIGRIEYLSLREAWSSDEGAPGLSDDDVAELARCDRLDKLRGLDLGHNEQLGPSSVESILDSPWCGQLEYLGLAWAATGDEGASLIASTDRLENLRRLDLSNTGLGPAGARTLADSRSLARLGVTELDFSLNDVGSEENARLLRSPVLARVGDLRLDGEINAELVDGFLQSDCLGSMKNLSFANSWTIEAASLRRLARWTGLARLESLTFVLSGLSDEQLEILANSPWLADLKSLLLSEARVSDDGIERLCRSPAWRGLTELGVDRNNLTERSVRAIVGAAWFHRLVSLDLHASYTIGDPGASVLASYRGASRLRRLTLSRAGIGDDGALALAEASFAEQLWMLTLWGNKDVSPTTKDLLKRRFDGRLYTDKPEVPEPWRWQPRPRA
jgi:uncharacterized protein (TIGR02996 family)